jgi:hypothetical protein
VKFRLEIDFDVQGLLRFETQILEPLNIKSSWYRYGAANVEPKQLQVEQFTFNLSPPAGIGQAFQPGGYSTPRSTDPASAQRLAQTLHQEVVRLGALVSQTLTKIFVIPLFRGFSEPSYQLQPTRSADLMPRAGLIQMGNALASNLAYIEPSEKIKIHKWMKDIMGVDIDWRPVPGGQIAIENPQNETFFVNEGFGSNQLTFILEEIARAEDGSFIGVEEPEIHLHPAAQFKFGKTISAIAKAEKKQILLVTHSEHIISAILTSIREKIVNVQDVSIWHFVKKDHEISATRAEIDADGHTKGGLTTFIEESIKELKEYASASSS